MRSLFLQVGRGDADQSARASRSGYGCRCRPCVAIALVVMVLLAFLAMANGFQRTIEGSGADDIGSCLRGGSQAEVNSDHHARAGAAHRGRRPASRAGRTASRWSRRSSIWWSTASSAPPAPRPTCRCAASASRARRCARASPSRRAACSTAAANEIVIGKGLAQRVHRARDRQHRRLRHHALDRGRRLRSRRQRVRIGDLGRPAGGAEPVQPQQLFSDRAGAAREPRRARTLKGYNDGDRASSSTSSPKTPISPTSRRRPPT